MEENRENNIEANIDAQSEAVTDNETMVNMDKIEENSSCDNQKSESDIQSDNNKILMDDIEKQLKEAKKKGRTQGIIMSLAIVFVIFAMWTGVKFVVSVVDGSIYAKATGFFGGSILDKTTVNKIESLYKTMANTYIDEVDKDKVREGIYKGMLEALEDPYSVYYSKEEYDEMMESSSGTFEGIGAYLSQNPEDMEVKVVRPIKNSPAEKAGILMDDVIVEVDGEDVTGQDINLVVSKVRGKKGTTVNIGIKRKGSKDIIYFDVVRDKVNEESVTSEMYDDNIGYIYISEFAEATGDQFIEAYDKLLEDGMESLIIDLRTNGGGYVDTAVKVADRLVKDGTIVSIKDRRGVGYTYKDAGDDNYCDIPCVVLVDGNTASASEILTGALKDYGLATVIGTNTFGKGIVQDVMPLGDGSGVKITNSKYYTPNGENIHGVGIEPDYVVEWDGENYVENGVDNQLEAAKKFLTDGTVE